MKPDELRKIADEILAYNKMLAPTPDDIGTLTAFWHQNRLAVALAKEVAALARIEEAAQEVADLDIQPEDLLTDKDDCWCWAEVYAIFYNLKAALAREGITMDNPYETSSAD